MSTALATLENPRAVIGGNQPPGPIEFAQIAIADLRAWLTETPVIETDEQARAGGLFVERLRKTLGEVEDERDAKVRPLNEQVAEINAEYKAVHNADPKKPGTADRILNELRARLTAYAQAEEAKRTAAAEAARRAAEEAERIAHEAEAAEREAIDNAKAGELVDVGGAVLEADSRFKDFKRADRAAARAEAQTSLRIPSGLGGKALSMRTVETLTITSASQALKAMGLTEKVKDAILSSARDYRKQHDTLPPGVASVTSRQL